MLGANKNKQKIFLVLDEFIVRLWYKHQVVHILYGNC